MNNYQKGRLLFYALQTLHYGDLVDGGDLKDYLEGDRAPTSRSTRPTQETGS